MRDVNRRLRAALWAAVAIGIVATISPNAVVPNLASVSANAGSARTPAVGARGAGGHSAARATPGSRTSASGTEVAGTFVPFALGPSGTVPVAQLTARTVATVAPLRRLRTADVLVVAPRTLPQKSVTAARRLAGVQAFELLDAARLKLNGGSLAVLGVDPSQFRAFAAPPTARSSALWENVADGGIAVSYLMGEQERLPLGGMVTVTGARAEELRVGGFGTVGISGVDAVVSHQVARSLGMPAGNAIVISAPRARLSVLVRQLEQVLPSDASIVPLVAQAPIRGLPVTTGSAGGFDVTAADGPALTAAQTQAFLAAAESRLGLPYVWGGAGPFDFDCSGLVQWAMRQAGIIMPRVAVDQAETGPLVPVGDVQPGDLLFYHTDPTAPEYISHVAIYLGGGMMLQAPEPGMNVEIVRAVFTGGFAGAVAVYPRLAAAVAAQF